MILPTAPISAFIQLTAECNNGCPGCSNKFQNSTETRMALPDPLSANEWKAVFKELKPHVTRLRITGGEAPLHPEFDAILEYLSELKIPFSLFTNGRWKNPKQIIDQLLNCPEYRGMLVSLHGSNAKEHEAFSNINGSFEETVSNIKLALKNGLRVHTNTVITKQNYGSINNLYSFASELGISMVVIARLIGDSSPDLAVAPEELREAVNQVELLRSKKAKIKHSGCIPQCFMASGAWGCTAAITFCTIDPWGNICPCNHVAYYCGNILNTSILEVWKSPMMAKWRLSIPDECTKCAAYGKCHGGCHAAGCLLGQVNDPLMSAPIKTAPTQEPQAINIKLSRNKKPELCCYVRPEPFGFLLVRDVYSLPVSKEAEAILSACNGTMSLNEILEHFGQAGLNFVGTLVKRGYIKLN